MTCWKRAMACIHLPLKGLDEYMTDSTSSRSPDPQLEMVFTETLALMRGWAVLGTPTPLQQKGLIIYVRSNRAGAMHYCVCDHGIVICLATRRDVADYMASRRGGQL